MARIHRSAIQKDLHGPDNHDGVISHLEPDILECKIKWTLGSITTNKASGGDEIPVELFKSWKMMLWKCYTQYVSKYGKLSSGHRTGKGQFSFQSRRKAVSKNAQTTTWLHSSHTLAWRRHWHPLQCSCLENSMDGGAWEATVHGVMKSQTRLSDFMHWRRKWQPTPLFLPGKSQGQGSLVGCRLWGHTEMDKTGATWQQQRQC